MDHDNLKALLDAHAARINSPEFIADDPVQFPRLYTSLPDIEIAALLSATIAWGNRRMICRDCSRMLAMMEHRPLDYTLDRAYEDLDPGMNLHRTFFARHLQAWLRALAPLYRRHGSLQAWARTLGLEGAEAPSWLLAEALGQQLREANPGMAELSRCLPMNVATTALKRLNMALRWLVRTDGIVDLGVWDIITPAQLYLPLDVHVGRTARRLGILSRNSDDRKAATELTLNLRRYDAADPCRYDYALFGLGISPTVSAGNGG